MLSLDKYPEDEHEFIINLGIFVYNEINSMSTTQDKIEIINVIYLIHKTTVMGEQIQEFKKYLETKNFEIIYTDYFNKYSGIFLKCELKQYRKFAESIKLNYEKLIKNIKLESTTEQTDNSIKREILCCLFHECDIIKRKTRKSCEYNYMEYLFAYILSNKSCSYTDIISDTIPPKLKCNKEKLDGYKKDMASRKDIEGIFNKIKTYLSECDYFNKDIKNVYLTGKKIEFEEINNRHKIFLNDHEKDKKDIKADIFIIYEDDTMEGISIKSSKNATKTNYSITKYFNETDVEECKKIKLQYLKQHHLENYTKPQRKEVNKLFYHTNPVFEFYESCIKKNNQTIRKSLVDSLEASKIPYTMYEFDGEKAYKLQNTIEYDKIIFEKCEEYYYKKKGDRRETAKMFYSLQYNDKKYKVEIRWKGEIKTASPQFQVFLDS